MADTAVFQSLKGILVDFNQSDPQGKRYLVFQSLKGILVDFNFNVALAALATNVCFNP